MSSLSVSYTHLDVYKRQNIHRMHTPARKRESLLLKYMFLYNRDFATDVYKRQALVIMAAGMGSRYGGNKQVDGIGPNGEILMEYSIFDALRAVRQGVRLGVCKVFHVEDRCV